MSKNGNLNSYERIGLPLKASPIETKSQRIRKIYDSTSSPLTQDLSQISGSSYSQTQDPELIPSSQPDFEKSRATRKLNFDPPNNINGNETTMVSNSIFTI